MTDDLGELGAWFEHVTGPDWLWFVKYLAANDTYAKPNVHQGGPYLAKELVRSVFPKLAERTGSEKNPDLTIHASLDSHGYSRDVRVVCYNSKLLGKKNGRNEARMTQWGGQDVPLLAADSTGNLVVFAYHLRGADDADGCRVWVCRSPAEEDLLLDRVGPVEPGAGLIYSPAGAVLPLVGPIPRDRPCSLSEEELPEAWRAEFPTGEAIIAEVVERLPSANAKAPDDRLLDRRTCEYDLFRSVEEIYTMPRLREGFASVDLFVDFANAVTNRRKARSGKSLELHAGRIFDEEGLSYSHGKQTEDKRTPDFVFPSIERYHDGGWDPSKLRMLAAKTTCKDRWRQILNEAKRIGRKHLLTLQEGVSTPQFREMQESGVILVVPEPLREKYPEDVQPELVSLESFIAETRETCGDRRSPQGFLRASC
jgi:hypothetical protein